MSEVTQQIINKLIPNFLSNEEEVLSIGPFKKELDI